MQGDPSFRDYLEARFAVDSESLNRKAFAAFVRLLSRKENPVVLDVGTGTGAMIRRIIASAPERSMLLYGVDANRDLLEAARHEINLLLSERGYAIKGGDQITTATKGRATLEIRLVPGDLFDEKLRASLLKIPFNIVTAHAFMDGVPVGPALALFAGLLPKEGIFYSTLNYDGTTELLPFFENRPFEEELLAAYNRAMDRGPALAEGRGSPPAESGASLASAPGGTRAGSLLYTGIVRSGFSIAGFGSSDWTVFPWDGNYSHQEEIFLNSLILTIYEEGLRHPDLDRYTLSAWYAERSSAIEERRLTLVTHQTDIVAVRT